MDANEGVEREWRVYLCQSCGGLVTAWAFRDGGEVFATYPDTKNVSEEIPERPQNFLKQAIETIHAPAGSVMLAASAVDSMLKAKNYEEGSLYRRIDQAAADNLITNDMAEWAHEIRLDANDQRHADVDAGLPTKEDAERCVEFALALAEILFVLPAKVQRGINRAKS